MCVCDTRSAELVARGRPMAAALGPGDRQARIFWRSPNGRACAPEATLRLSPPFLPLLSSPVPSSLLPLLTQVLALAFSPDGRSLAVVAADNAHTVYVYDWMSGNKARSNPV